MPLYQPGQMLGVIYLPFLLKGRYEENVTTARVSGQDPVSLAAIIQHNTSGLAVRADSGITSPAQLVGQVYGSFDDPFEPYVISSVIDCAGGKVTPAEIKKTSPVISDDGLASLEIKKADYAWIYYGWEGIEFQRAGLKFNYFPHLQLLRS